jgi:hypothetical protein
VVIADIVATDVSGKNIARGFWIGKGAPSSSSIRRTGRSCCGRTGMKAEIDSSQSIAKRINHSTGILVGSSDGSC